MSFKKLTISDLEELIEKNVKSKYLHMTIVINHYDLKNNGDMVKKYLLKQFDGSLDRNDIIMFLKYGSLIELYLNICDNMKKNILDGCTNLGKQMINKFIANMKTNICEICYMELMCGEYNGKLICVTCCPIIDGELLIDPNFITVV